MRIHPLDNLRYPEFKKKNRKYKNILIKLIKKYLIMKVTLIKRLFLG